MQEESKLYQPATKSFEVNHKNQAVAYKKSEDGSYFESNKVNQ